MTQQSIFTLDLSIQDLQVIDSALAEMPYRLASPVVDRINAQIKSQRPQPAESALEADPPTS